MSSQNIIKVLSSDGKVNSVANENIVIKEDPSHTAFAWKQLSLKVFADCKIVINENTDSPSYLTLPSGLELQLDNLPISSLSFTTSGVSYYFIAGY